MKTLFAILAVSFAIASVAPATEPINDKCPVCGKTIRLIFHSNDSKGQRVAFATADCKDKFDKAPGKYTVKPKG
jgi:YHS domain-containing protein